MLPLALALFMATHTDRAVECDEDNPTLCTAYLEAGDQAPFQGYLNSIPKGIQDAQSLAGWPKRLELELQARDKIHEAELAAARALVTKTEADVKQYLATANTERARADKLADEIANPPFYKTVQFGIVLGVSGTLLTTLALAALAGAF